MLNVINPQETSDKNPSANATSPPLGQAGSNRQIATSVGEDVGRGEKSPQTLSCWGKAQAVPQKVNVE